MRSKRKKILGVCASSFFYLLFFENVFVLFSSCVKTLLLCVTMKRSDV